MPVPEDPPVPDDVPDARASDIEPTAGNAERRAGDTEPRDQTREEDSPVPTISFGNEGNFLLFEVLYPY